MSGASGLEDIHPLRVVTLAALSIPPTGSPNGGPFPYAHFVYPLKFSSGITTSRMGASPVPSPAPRLPTTSSPFWITRFCHLPCQSGRSCGHDSLSLCLQRPGYYLAHSSSAYLKLSHLNNKSYERIWNRQDCHLMTNTVSVSHFCLQIFQASSPGIILPLSLSLCETSSANPVLFQTYLESGQCSQLTPLAPVLFF